MLVFKQLFTLLKACCSIRCIGGGLAPYSQIVGSLLRSPGGEASCKNGFAARKMDSLLENGFNKFLLLQGVTNGIQNPSCKTHNYICWGVVQLHLSQIVGSLLRSPVGEASFKNGFAAGKMDSTNFCCCKVSLMEYRTHPIKHIIRFVGGGLASSKPNSWILIEIPWW